MGHDIGKAACVGVLPLPERKTGQKMRKRSITIDGHRTSITLEDAFWEELSALAKGRDLSISALVAEVDHARSSPGGGLGGGPRGGPGNLSSALRLHVLESLKRKINPA
jgi:predicted DNA-binding ribbon-helix-helix protein